MPVVSLLLALALYELYDLAVSLRGLQFIPAHHDQVWIHWPMSVCNKV